MENQTVDFYEIYDYYTQPLLEKTSTKIIIIISIIILVSLVIHLILQRYRKPLKAWEIAIKELTLLKPEGCVTKNDFKQFYFKLTNIFKRYLNRHYNWQTENKTDEELLKYLQQQNFNQESLTQLHKIFDGARWIKFANQNAFKIQAEADLKTIIKIIEQTKPIDAK